MGEPVGFRGNSWIHICMVPTLMCAISESCNVTESPPNGRCGFTPQPILRVAGETEEQRTSELQRGQVRPYNREKRVPECIVHTKHKLGLIDWVAGTYIPIFTRYVDCLDSEIELGPFILGLGLL